MKDYELEYGEVNLDGKNNDKNIVGSHHLIVELIKGITELDAQNMIITSFTASIKFTKNPDVERIELTDLGTVDGVEVSIDTSQLERLQNFKNIQDPNKQKLLEFIDYYATEVGWMTPDKFHDFAIQLVNLLCKAWSRNIVMAILYPTFDVDSTESYDPSVAASLSYVELNDILKILEVKYKIRKVGGSQYKVDRI